MTSTPEEPKTVVQEPVSKNVSSRGQHRMGRQMRMDIEVRILVEEVLPNRLKDDILILFDEDFLPSIKGVKDWLIEVHQALDSYWRRNSKKEEILRKNLGFLEGMRYMLTVCLSELTLTQGEDLAKRIEEDLGPLLATFCADCKKIIEDE